MSKKKASRWWEYELEATSGRFISNDILAAIGRAQLRKLPEFIERRRQIWDYYQAELADIRPLVRPPEPLPETTSSLYLYWIRVPEGRDELAQYLADNGVYTTFRYYPLHRVDYFGADSDLPAADQVAETTLNLPLHQNLDDGDVQKIVDLVRRFFRSRGARRGNLR
jgi:aminotransferase